MSWVSEAEKSKVININWGYFGLIQVNYVFFEVIV